MVPTNASNNDAIQGLDPSATVKIFMYLPGRPSGISCADTLFQVGCENAVPWRALRYIRTSTQPLLSKH